MGQLNDLNHWNTDMGNSTVRLPVKWPSENIPLLFYLCTHFSHSSSITTQQQSTAAEATKKWTPHGICHLAEFIGPHHSQGGGNSIYGFLGTPSRPPSAIPVMSPKRLTQMANGQRALPTGHWQRLLLLVQSAPIKHIPLSYLWPIIFRGLTNWGHSARVHGNISITVSVLHFSQHNISPAPH